jgi:hypothetical protein
MQREVKIREPITQNKSIKVNCVAFTLKNVGNSTAMLDTNWSIEPGEQITIGFPACDDYLSQTFHITFVPTGQINKLNFLTIH